MGSTHLPTIHTWRWRPRRSTCAARVPGLAACGVVTSVPLRQVLGADLVHAEKYNLPALAAAVVKHTAPGGVAYLMLAVTLP